MKLIFVCSPYRNKNPLLQQENVRIAEKIVDWIIKDFEHAAFAPHLYYTQYLEDSVEKERRLGLASAMKHLSKSDEMWVLMDKSGEVSEGMQKEIAFAIATQIPIYYIVKAAHNKNGFLFNSSYQVEENYESRHSKKF